MDNSLQIQNMPQQNPSQAVNTVLARLIQLAVAVQKAESAEKAGNIIVNQIQTLVTNDRTLIVHLQGKKRIFCVSGDIEPSEDNPFSQAAEEIRKHLRGKPEAQILSTETLPPDMDMPNARKVMDSMGGTGILWLPLFDYENTGEHGFALWMERWNKKPWNPEEIRLLSHAAVFFGQALNRPKSVRRKSRSGIVLALFALLLFCILMWLPVYSRINAPFQVVPDSPRYVSAPFDGVVEELAVRPGQEVRKGDLIFRYDTRVLEKRLEEAFQGVAVALAELDRLEGAAYSDEEARAKIPVQKLEVERKQAEVTFFKKQIELSEVRTDTDGVVVLDDPDALIGAFLQTGEMVLRVADPKRTKPRIMVPVSDAGLVIKDSPVDIRLDSDPLRVINAKVERIGFDVKMSDERIPSVLVEAVWEGDAAVTPGQRGIAKIRGPQVRLGMQIFRKPFTSLRTMLGI